MISSASRRETSGGESILYSPSWYRVADLKPKLKSHIRIHRHRYRGAIGYVLQNPSNEKYYRFNPGAYECIGRMDGTRTVQEIWRVADERLGEAAPTQDQFISLLSQLHGADALQCNVPPDMAELLERYEKQSRRRWVRQLMSPLFWRVPLIDPERLLQKGIPWVRPLFGRAAFLAWLAVACIAAGLACIHGHDLTHNLADRILTPKSLLLMWILVPALKCCHEFGHAFAVKAYGGEVHEMGVMFLVLTPIPYVNASAASAFPGKRERIVVGAAGMMTEFFAAAIALFLWLAIEPGTLRTVLFNIMFIAGVSTLLFNANPLLRFDGYYILSDILEMPNLKTRSSRYAGYLAEKYILGNRRLQPFRGTRREKAWLLGYAVSSWTYRMAVLTAILLFVAGRLFFLGVILALWAILFWAVIPFFKWLHTLAFNPRLRHVRGRAIGVSACLAFLMFALICLIPLPLRTTAEGVVWIPEEAIVRAGADGFVAALAARSGSRVKRGDPLVVCEDIEGATAIKILEAKLAELRARRDEARLKDRVKADLLLEEAALIKKSLARERERLSALTIRSPADGTFILPKPDDLPGRHIAKGAVIAWVLDMKRATTRVVVPQESIHLVRSRTRGITARFAEKLPEILPATIIREVPAASTRLPSSVLSTRGGGSITIDPLDSQGTTSLDRFFQVDLALPVPAGVINAGGRVYVRFDHGWEPVAKRWCRSVRRLFLRRFNV